MWDEEVVSEVWREVVRVLICSESEVTSLTSVSFCERYVMSALFAIAPNSRPLEKDHNRVGGRRGEGGREDLPLVYARWLLTTTSIAIASLPPFEL